MQDLQGLKGDYEHKIALLQAECNDRIAHAENERLTLIDARQRAEANVSALQQDAEQLAHEVRRLRSDVATAQANVVAADKRADEARRDVEKMRKDNER